MSRIAYDMTMNKWYYHDLLNGKGDNDLSSVWKEGYDDPTYLTFKVEFGDWGASVLDRSVLDLGVTTFKAQYADYDLLPIGLLNAPSESSSHDPNVWQTGAGINGNIFNNTPSYSAFTYLRSRNEDIRAEYIMHFVNGLFDILKKYPYIFKKISGINNLETVDVKKGRRISDVEISLECYEGLDLKIKTLLELYRKAAWDDVYQRWILPDNMREFKMIIYIFERRTFQKFEEGSLKMDNEVNLNIPVKVFECIPCEFILDSIWGNDFSTSENTTEASTTIKIKVKNVKTFYKNGLMNTNIHNFYNNANGSDIDTRIDPLMIYDLVDRMDRYKPVLETTDITSSAITNTTINGIRSRFMSKNVFLSNEEYADIERKSQEYTTWVTNLVLTPNKIIESINKLYGSSGNNIRIGNIMASSEDVNKSKILLNYYPGASSNANDTLYGVSKTKYIKGLSPLLESGLLYEYRAPFYYYYVNRPIGYGRLAFSSPIGNIIKLVGELINPRTIPYTNLYLLPLPEPFYITPNNRLLATIEMSNPLYKLVNYENEWWNDNGKLNTNIIEPREINLELLTLDPDKKTDTSDKNLNTLISSNNSNDDMMYDMIYNENPTELQLLLELNEPKSKNVEKNLYGLNEPLITVETELLTLNDVVNTNKNELSTLDFKFREIKLRLMEFIQLKKIENNDQLIELIPKNKENIQKLNILNESRKITNEQLAKLDIIDRQISQKLNTLEYKEAQTKPDSLNKVKNSRNITLQEFELLNAPVNKPTTELSTIVPKERNIKDSLQEIVLQIRLLPGMETFTIDDAREIPTDKLYSLQLQVNDTIPNYQVDKNKLIKLINTIELKELTEQLVTYDKPKKLEEQNLLDQLKLNTALQTIENIKTKDKDILHKQELLSYIQEYVKNSESIKLNYEDELIKKKKKLIDLTNESINNLPYVEMYTLKENEKENNEVLISLNDLKQIEKNIELIGLEEKAIRSLSTLTLVELNDSIELEIKNTQSMIGLTKDIEQKLHDINFNKLEDKKIKNDNNNNKKKKRLGESAKLKEPKEKKNDKIVY